MNFKELVISKGYNSYTLAKKVNRSHSTIHRWMQGVNEPSCELIVELAKILQVPIKDVVLSFVDEVKQDEK